MKQFESCLCIFLSILVKTTVGDYSEHIVLILLIQAPCLFVVTCEKHLRTSTHAKHLCLRVECLGGEVETLRKNILIQMGKY